MGLLKRTQSVFRDFMALIYPNFCLSCGETVYKNESVICLKCLYALPRTNFHTDKENPCNKIFWGKVKIEQATAFCFFEQKGKVQKMIHELKYKGKREVGYLLGKRMGEEIKQTPPFNAVDYVVPVPLHPDKYKKRDCQRPCRRFKNKYFGK
jgi:predicted amidophosphoribosyltransferase